MTTWIIAHVLFGLIIGSFLNVLILRYGTGRSLLGRSRCSVCGAALAWFELIPVISWVVLRGACQRCNVRISIQYPLVEGIMGSFFGIVAGLFLPLLLHMLALTTVSALVFIAVYDIRHTIIPDQWVYGFAALTLLFFVFSGAPSFLEIVERIIAGAALTLPFMLLWLFSGGEWMGLGDAKLILGIGWLLGFSQAFSAILLAFVLGAIVSVALVGLSSNAWKRFVSVFTPTPTSKKLTGQFTMKSAIPFGPFLIGTCLATWFFGLYGIEFDLLYLMYSV